MQAKKVYFPNLNGLRFIAALLVIIHHVDQIKLSFSLPSYWDVPFVNVIGKLGVVLFFVLSGFLITYLLLTEETVSGRISIRDFYIRRMLRIWPLYFLTIVLGFAVWPYLLSFPDYTKDVLYQDLTAKLLLYVFFLPNLALHIFGISPFLSHTWSIGTEEQYYLVWPVILKNFRKHRLVIIISVVIVYLAIRSALYLPVTDFILGKDMIRAFWGLFNIDCMAIGALFAVILFQKTKLLPLLTNNVLFYVTLIATFVLIGFGVYVPKLHFEFYSVLFGIIILNFAANPTVSKTLESRLFRYLGNISYGLYMYHPVCIVITILVLRQVGGDWNWTIYVLSLALTIAFAGLSYRYYESYFLGLKAKFSVIASDNGENAKKNS